jgi:hypothetical protein
LPDRIAAPLERAGWLLYSLLGLIPLQQSAFLNNLNHESDLLRYSWGGYERIKIRLSHRSVQIDDGESKVQPVIKRAAARRLTRQN